MKRRHFLKLSGATSAAVIFSRLTSFADNVSIVNMPDEVWAQSDEQWHKLTLSRGIYSYQDIRVRFTNNGGALSVFAASPTLELNAVRVGWNYSLKSGARVLGDKLERSYGDQH